MWEDAKGKSGVNELAKSYDHSSGWSLSSQSVEIQFVLRDSPCPHRKMESAPPYTGENTCPQSAWHLTVYSRLDLIQAQPLNP